MVNSCNFVGHQTSFQAVCQYVNYLASLFVEFPAPPSRQTPSSSSPQPRPAACPATSPQSSQTPCEWFAAAALKTNTVWMVRRCSTENKHRVNGRPLSHWKQTPCEWSVAVALKTNTVWMVRRCRTENKHCVNGPSLSHWKQTPCEWFAAVALKTNTVWMVRRCRTENKQFGLVFWLVLF